MPFHCGGGGESCTLAALGLETKSDMHEEAPSLQGCFYVFLQMLQTQVPSMGSSVSPEAPREEGFWGGKPPLSRLGFALLRPGRSWLLLSSPLSH